MSYRAAATHPTGAFSYMPESFPETLKNEVSGSEKFIECFLQEIFPMGEDYAFFAEEIVNMLANDGAQGGRKLFNLVNRFNELGPQHEKYRFIYILFYHLIWEAMNLNSPRNNIKFSWICIGTDDKNVSDRPQTLTSRRWASSRRYFGQDRFVDIQMRAYQFMRREG